MTLFEIKTIIRRQRGLFWEAVIVIPCGMALLFGVPWLLWGIAG